MTLAVMYAADRDALLCDLAETYGVYDFRALPVATVAVLACGLRADSRIAARLSAERREAETSAGFDTPEAFLAARAQIMEG